MSAIGGNCVALSIDGVRIEVPAGTTVAAAIAIAERGFRRSVAGQARAAFCGMGVCGECRVSIDGVAQSLSCLLPCRAGMQVRGDA